MNADIQTLLFVLGFSILLVVLATALHLILFRLLLGWYKRLKSVLAIHVAGAVVVALVFHLLEIVLFALGIFLLTGAGRFGRLIGVEQGDIPNYFYYSTVTYTTLGFGDIVPSGPVRLVTAFESLTGLVLTAWTASIIFSWVLRVVSDQNQPH